MDLLWTPLVRWNWVLVWTKHINKKRKISVYHDFSLTLALTKGKWACKRMFTCTGEHSYLEKSVKMRNFAPANSLQAKHIFKEVEGAQCASTNIHWNFSLGRWKEAVWHGNNPGGWRPAFRIGRTHQTTVERWWDPGLLREGSGVPAQRLGSLVGDTSCRCWTAGHYRNRQHRNACDKNSSSCYANYCSLTWKRMSSFC